MPRSALTIGFRCILQDSRRFPRTFLDSGRFPRTFLVAAESDACLQMPRSALTIGFCCILEAVACFYLPRGALAGSFCRILGAFHELFSWLQKATLGSSLPSNASQRPYHRLLLHSGGSSMPLPASRRLRRKLLQHCGRFPRIF